MPILITSTIRLNFVFLIWSHTSDQGLNQALHSGITSSTSRTISNAAKKKLDQPNANAFNTALSYQSQLNIFVKTT